MKYLALLVLLVGCGLRIENGNIVSGPKFNVGDCVQTKFEVEDVNEFGTNPTRVRKIEKVGKHNYYYNFNYPGYPMYIEFNIESLDGIGVKVDCPPER